MKTLESILVRAERHVPFFCGVWASGLFGLAAHDFVTDGLWVASMLAAVGVLGVGMLLEWAEPRE